SSGEWSQSAGGRAASIGRFPSFGAGNPHVNLLLEQSGARALVAPAGRWGTPVSVRRQLQTQRTMNNRSGWKVRALLGLSVGWGCVAVASAQTTDGAGEEVMLERFEVTGSRVTRIAAEGPNPVTVFRRADIEVGGYTNIGDALRTHPYVSGSNLMPAGSNNSFTPGASTVNLRGLGNNNVLVLLNGRRAAPLSTPGFNGLQTMFDFNSIPEAAIESIEILKDAGSAIYGSDAV